MRKSSKERATIGEREVRLMGVKGIEPGEMEAFLGNNTSFEGKMAFEGMARLDGSFNGEVSSGDFLFIGEHADIDAEIKVGTLVVDGKVRGNVSAASKVAIQTTGKLYGNIDTPVLVIEEGGLFEGSCKMDKGVGASSRKVALLQGKDTKEEEAKEKETETGESVDRPDEA